MIWDYIRDFFVQYIFGGVDSLGDSYGGKVGTLITDNIDYTEVDSSSIFFPIGKVGFNFDIEGISDTYITFGDWLSTTATIICMILISICFILLIRWIFKAVTSAFLLK